MSHDPHGNQPGYSSAQVLHDGCSECAWRGQQPNRAIEHMDMSAFTRAWQRAGQREMHGLPDMALAEALLLEVLAAIQIKLENFGIPIGVLPGTMGAPVVVRPPEPAAPRPDTVAPRRWPAPSHVTAEIDRG